MTTNSFNFFHFFKTAGTNIGAAILKWIKSFKFRRGPVIVTLVVFVVSSIIVINSMDAHNGVEDVSEFAAGKVAEQDVIAAKPVSYIDEDATTLLIEEQKRLVPAVFRYDAARIVDSNMKYGHFESVCTTLFDKAEQDTEDDDSVQQFRAAIYAEFPNVFPAETLDTLFQSPNRRQLLSDAKNLLDDVMSAGIFFLPDNATLSRYNPVMVEAVGMDAPHAPSEQVPFDRVITMDKIQNRVESYLVSSPSTALKGAGYDLVKHFLQENLFFSQQDTDARVKEAAARVEPVYIHIEQGQRIIKKGFVIREADMLSLDALNLALSQPDYRGVSGQIVALVMICALFVFAGSVKLAGRDLNDSEIYLLIIITGLYIVAAALAKNMPPNDVFFPISILLPTALAVMLPAILIGRYLAFVWAFLLPTAGFLTGAFDMSAFVIALAGGVVSSFALEHAERRMDLVRAGLAVAGANCAALIAMMLIQHTDVTNYPYLLFWTAFNGLASGMLVLGILPPLENWLNAATTFRLIELSDLNAPIIKRLFTIAPGTYSHSFMVAQLAEAACKEIRANSLLARVGAYYHDIGKMDQPEYFVENQEGGHNKHDELPPRLSATILRSHVKLGVEKARAMKLPREVIDIIAQHHGNSIIQYFYHKALEQEKDVSIEVFSYPGNPPRSREAAVVMIADTCEAAVRTLEKKTANKIEEFIQTLINNKLEQGQLAESELTFRDLETIKMAFVRVLASYYHSRIEYPKEKKEENAD